MADYYYTIDGDDASDWFMRSPGNEAGKATNVGADGQFFDDGDSATNDRGVRPAIVIKLK